MQATVVRLGRATAAITAVIVATALAVGGFWLASMSQRQIDQRDAANLDVRALSALSGSPRLASTLALDAWKRNHSDSAESTMQSVALANPGVVRSWTAGQSAIQEIVVSRGYVYAAALDGTVFAWRQADNRLVDSVSVGTSAFGLVLDSTGQEMAVATASKIVLYGIEGGKLAPAGSIATSSAYTGLEFNPDGTELAGWTDGTKPGIWKVSDQQALSAPTIHTPGLTGLPGVNGQAPRVTITARDDYNKPDWTELVETDGQQLFRVNLTTGVATELAQSTAWGNVTALSEDADGDIAIGDRSGIVTYNNDGAELMTLNGSASTASVTSIAWLSPEQLVVGTASDTALVTFDSRGVGDTIGIVGQMWSNSTSAATTVSADQVIVGGDDGQVALVSTSNDLVGPAPAKGSNDVTFAPGGLLVLASNDGSDTNRSFGLYAIDPTKPLAEDGSHPVVHRYVPPTAWWPTGSAFYINSEVADSEFVVATGMDPSNHGAVLVWNAATGAPVVRLPFTDGSQDSGAAPYDIVSSAVLLPQAHELAAYNAGAGAVQVWSTTTWHSVATIVTGGLGKISANGNNLVGARNDGRQGIVTIDVATRSVSTLDPNGTFAEVVADPSSSELAAISMIDSRVEYLDTAGKTLAVTPLPAAPMAAAWQPGSHRLAVVLDGGQVAIVDANHRLVGPILKSDAATVGGRIAWDGTTGLIATASLLVEATDQYDGPVTLWKVDLNWASSMCRLIGTNYTADEWRQEVGGNYSKLCN